MTQLFTVRWSWFARLEAVLLFPVVMLLASDLRPVRMLVDRQLVPKVSPTALQFGVPWHYIVWGSTVAIVIVPYLILLVVADRFMTIRRGYALLSIAAIALWTGGVWHLADQLAPLVPANIIAALDWRPFDQKATLAAGAAALLLHLWPLCVGIRDKGEVADRLLAAREGPPAEDEEEDRARQHALYLRQTGDFRGWQTRDKFHGLAIEQRETPAIKIIYAVTWLGVALGAVAAWQSWDSFSPFRGSDAPETPIAPPKVAEGPLPGQQRTMPLAPAPAKQGESHAAVAPPPPPMPMVQRPGEVPLGVFSGPNEAVAERNRDGSFGFDAVVNGSHVPMLFDTGATVVALRAEDAVRIGINVTRLTYSAKVKTANGIAEVAPIVIDSLSIGGITERRVSGFVAKQGMLQMNLLGQTFLARLAGYNVENDHLVLKGR